MKEKFACIFGFICIVTVIFILFSKGFADQERAEGDPPTFDEIREYIIKGEARSNSRLSHLLSTSSTQRNYDATYYRLDIAIDENTETVGGDVLMVGRSLVDSLSIVEIDLYDNMQVDSVKSSGQVLGFTRSNNVLSATLSATVNIDELFIVRIFYSGTPQSVGWGSFGFDTHGVNNDPIIWSLSEPDAARTWWPCNDDPSDKADSVDIHLTVSDDLVASSQGTLESEIDNGDGTKTFHWKERYPITTYLVSVAISNYETISDLYVSPSGDSMPVIHYVYPESYDDALEDFNVTVPMMEAFVEIFGEYPFLQEKYAHSEFPWGGAMEHQTNCTYGTGLITGNHWYDMFVAHELAHQWWGDMITCETWEDIWLNEGFASYGEALWAEHLGGFDEYRAYMIDLDRYYTGGNFSGPLYDPTQLFGSTVYNKGAWALHMLRHVLGDSTFFQALWDYGHDPDLVFGTATTAELQDVLETSSSVDLDWFFQEWVYGSNRPNYEYWWGSEPSGNDHQLTVSLEQVQTNAPVFRMPVDIQVVTVSGETTFTVVDSLEVQEFVFMLPEEPQDVYIDRYNWILKHVRMVPPVGIGDDKPGVQMPRSLALHQNYPNPFNPSTVISYDIPVDLDGMKMSLVIYDIRGRNIRGLKTGPARGGKNDVTWDGRDDRGRPVGSGIYLYRLEINGRIEMKRMVLLK
jgi:aminopeptidase N